MFLFVWCTYCYLEPAFLGCPSSPFSGRMFSFISHLAVWGRFRRVRQDLEDTNLSGAVWHSKKNLRHRFRVVCFYLFRPGGILLPWHGTVFCLFGRGLPMSETWMDGWMMSVLVHGCTVVALSFLCNGVDFLCVSTILMESQGSTACKFK
jgi:hypothetical protein